LDAQVEGIAINDFITGQRRCHVAVIDITQRIKTEKNLAGIKERLELALEASATGTWELDLQTMQFNFDEFIYRICDIPFNNFGPNYQSFINYIHEADREMADQHFRTAVNTNMEVDIVCKFNNLYNEVSYINIRGHIAKEPDAKRFIGIMTDITEKRRLEEEASAFEFEQHKKITTATLYAEENERKRVSEALHDSVGQLLYGIKIQLGQLKKHPETSESLDQVNKLLSLAIQETRNISFELAPSILTDFGLPATIEELVRRLSSSQLMLQAKVTGFARRCDPLLELGIFRIVQELINNCMKHSGASLINVEIKRNKSIEILVNDNGKGFDVKRQEKTPTGSGLSSIKNRLGLYEGTLHIKSEAGKGTQVIIKMHPTDN
jgi:signal transduction histidine kinase